MGLTENCSAVCQTSRRHRVGHCAYTFRYKSSSCNGTERKPGETTSTIVAQVLAYQGSAYQDLRRDTICEKSYRNPSQSNVRATTPIEIPRSHSHQETLGCCWDVAVIGLVQRPPNAKRSPIR